MNRCFPVPVKVKAGSVVFCNGYLLHQSLKNRTATSYRRVRVNHYWSCESLLPWTQTVQGDPIARIDMSRVFPVAGVDSYTWQGYAQPEDTRDTQHYMRKAAYDGHCTGELGQPRGI